MQQSTRQRSAASPKQGTSQGPGGISTVLNAARGTVRRTLARTLGHNQQADRYPTRCDARGRRPREGILLHRTAPTAQGTAERRPGGPRPGLQHCCSPTPITHASPSHQTSHPLSPLLILLSSHFAPDGSCAPCSPWSASRRNYKLSQAPFSSPAACLDHLHTPTPATAKHHRPHQQRLTRGLTHTHRRRPHHRSQPPWRAYRRHQARISSNPRVPRGNIPTQKQSKPCTASPSGPAPTATQHPLPPPTRTLTHRRRPTGGISGYGRHARGVG